MTRRSTALATIVATWLAAEMASAADPAVEAFDRGYADMQAGRFDTACPAIEESYRLDPLAGARFTLAECYAGWGKPATAIRHYRGYLEMYEGLPPDQQERQRERRAVAEKQIEALASRVARITVVAPEGAVVTLGGELWPASQLARPIELDPGSYEFLLQTGGDEPEATRVDLAAGETRQLELSTSITPPLPPPVEPPPDHAAGGEPSQRTIALLVGGVGVAGLAVGSVFGILTLGKKGTIDDHCVDVVCDDEGADAAEAADTLGLVSTIGFVAGVAATGAAVVLFVTADDAAQGPVSGGWRMRLGATADGGGLQATAGGRF